MDSPYQLRTSRSYWLSNFKECCDGVVDRVPTNAAIGHGTITWKKSWWGLDSAKHGGICPCRWHLHSQERLVAAILVRFCPHQEMLKKSHGIPLIIILLSFHIFITIKSPCYCWNWNIYTLIKYQQLGDLNQRLNLAQHIKAPYYFSFNMLSEWCHKSEIWMQMFHQFSYRSTSQVSF